jgi:hypothetical protein
MAENGDNGHDWEDEANWKVLRERLSTFIRDSKEDRKYLYQSINKLQEDIQTRATALNGKMDDWIKLMQNRLPVWAVWVGWAMAMMIGSMAMWIITHGKT